jgi:hypothetical protein
VPAALGDPEREDLILEAGLRASCAVGEQYGVYADYTLVADDTEFRQLGEGADDPSYVRHEVVAGVTAAF